MKPHMSFELQRGHRYTYLFELKVDPSEEDGFGRHLEEVLDGLAVAQQRNQPGNLLQVDVAEEESLKDI